MQMFAVTCGTWGNQIPYIPKMFLARIDQTWPSPSIWGAYADSGTHVPGTVGE